MIAAKPTQPALPATASSPLETTAPPASWANAPALSNTAKPSGCPSCGFPVYHVLTTETRCANCGRLVALPAGIRSRLVAAWPGRGNWGRVVAGGMSNVEVGGD